MNDTGFLYNLDIEVYDPKTNPWAQGRYLVHGIDDSFWTDNIESVLEYLRDDLKRATERPF